MKRIILIALPLLFLLGSCRREDVRPGEQIDESYWLNQERGVVAYSDYTCDYFIIETYNGFTVMRSWGGFTPLRGSVLYGSFSRIGNRTFYNRSEGYLVQGDVRDYWLSYYEAIDQMDWYCSDGY
jgi:hypothetical protein